MILNGIYVRGNPDFLTGELSGSLHGLKRIENLDNLTPDSTGSVRSVVLFINDREGGWCHIQMTGDPEGIALVTRFLTDHKFLEKVLVWDCNHELLEYNYSFFQRGKLLEQFSVKGPALETVSFVSELREVQLQDLIKGRDFSVKAFESFGLNADSEEDEGSGRIRLDFSLPPKRSIWKSLLGILAGGE